MYTYTALYISTYTVNICIYICVYIQIGHVCFLFASTWQRIIFPSIYHVWEGPFLDARGVFLHIYNSWVTICGTGTAWFERIGPYLRIRVPINVPQSCIIRSLMISGSKISSPNTETFLLVAMAAAITSVTESESRGPTPGRLGRGWSGGSTLEQQGGSRFQNHPLCQFPL